MKSYTDYLGVSIGQVLHALPSNLQDLAHSEEGRLLVSATLQTLTDLRVRPRKQYRSPDIQRNRYQRLRQQGLCVRCGKAPRPGLSLCQPCHDKNIADARNRRKRT